MSQLDKLFLSVGAMKAGTTWLCAQLKNNPNIYVTPEKEMHYFAEHFTDYNPLSRDYRFGRMMTYLGRVNPNNVPTPTLQYYLRWYANFMMNVSKRGWYQRLFENCPEGAYASDFSNLTCHISDKGWAHAKAMTGQLRVLYTVRDPLDRIWSHIKFQNLQTGGELDVMAMSEADFKAYERQNNFQLHSNYGQIIKNLKRNLNNDQLLIVPFDDIAERPAALLKQIEGFLEIDHHDYSQNDGLSTRINRSTEDTMPDAFKAVYGDFARQICGELDDLGIPVPPSWHRP